MEKNTKYVQPAQLHGFMGEKITMSIDKELKNVNSLEDCTLLIQKLVTDENFGEMALQYISHRLETSPWEKQEARAILLREEGNKAYVKKNIQQALKVYSESILFGPKQTKCLGLAFANRSAVFFEMEDYDESLKDIERAFGNGYPEDLKFKLIRRKIECFVKMGQFKNAITGLVQAKSYAEKNGSNEKILNEINNLESQVNDLSEKESSLEIMQLKPEGDDRESLHCGSNPVIPCISSCLKVEYNEEKGRHIIAQKTLTVGDVVVVEDPFVFIILQERIADRCFRCAGEIKSVVPCERCTQVRYCSEVCRSESWKGSHSLECGYLNVLLEIGYPNIPSRIIMTAGLNRVLETDRKPGVLPGFNQSGCYDSSDYDTVFNLQFHQKLLDSETIKDAVYSSVLGIKLLQKIFREKSEGSPLDSDPQNVVRLSPLFVRHYLQSKCNTYSVSEIGRRRDEASQFQLTESTTAVGIYPAFSLLNHNCDPNVGSFPRGSRMIAKVIKPVREGEELCISYGPTRQESHHQLRKEFLKINYNFDCQCDACISDPKNESLFLAEQPQVPVSREAVLFKCLGYFDIANSSLNSGNSFEALAPLTNCLRVMDLEEAKTDFTKLFWKVNDLINFILFRFAQEKFFQWNEEENRIKFRQVRETLREALESIVGLEGSVGRECDLLCNYAVDYGGIVLSLMSSIRILDQDEWKEIIEKIQTLINAVEVKKGLTLPYDHVYLQHVRELRERISDLH